MTTAGLRSASDAIRYGFAVGKVRVLETRIFGRATYERLLDAPTFSEQLRVLSDTHYGRYLDGARSASDIERGLEEALDGFYRFLDEAKLPEDVVRYFRVRHDYANLKAKLKAEALDEPLTPSMLSALATALPEAFEGSADTLPPFLGGTYERLHARAEESPDGSRDELAAIDAAVDAAMFAELLAAAKSSGSRFLAELTRLMIDLANLKTAIRARARELSPASVSAMLIGGGTLTTGEVLGAYSQPAGALPELASRVPALRDLPAADLADPARIDVVADDFVVRFLRRARMVPVGAEPVIAYVMAREAEVVALRVLLIGKLAGVPAEALRARLRDLYV